MAANTIQSLLYPGKKKTKPGELVTEGRKDFEWNDTLPDDRGSKKNRISGDEIINQVENWPKEDIARSKIKPIQDPDGDKSSARRKAAKRRKAGRAGTLLSQGRETLG